MSFLGSIKLKGVEIKDHHNDTLIFVNTLNTSLLNVKRVLESEIHFSDLKMDSIYVYMKKYKNEKDDNLSIFINRFRKEKPKDSLAKPFVLKSKNIYTSNLNYKLIDENKENTILFSAVNGGGNIQDLALVGTQFSAKIRGLYFTDNRALQVTSLTSDFEYSKTAMHFKSTTLQTQLSAIHADIDFNYAREDLSDFLNKVTIVADFTKSSLAIKDLQKYYSELNGNDIVSFQGKMKGTLNNFSLKNLDLVSEKGIQIQGDLAFKNAINKEKGFVFNGDLKNTTATYKKLKNILPNVLGKTLPTEFDKLGTFNLKGKVNVTSEKINASVSLMSDIGAAISDLKISNIDNIDYASYSGDIQLKEFNAGLFFENPLFGKVSLKGSVAGSGFKLENINTSFVGKISKLNFKQYLYQNITANGNYENNKFEGQITIDDENFKMEFDGLADLSSEIREFDFKTNIEYLNLKKTNLFTRDSISILKGNIALDITGNTLDNITGNATFKDVFYTNENEEFVFEEFNIASAIEDDIKTIKVTSKDIAEGYISGRFSFKELPKVAQNALGSIYTNYKPYKVEPNQYVDYNFTIYNQIVSAFFPQISIDNKTKIKGRINSNKSLLRLNFSSPNLKIHENSIKNINLITDNQNPLYNTSLTADEIKTKYYSVSKLNLLNRTENDTLYFKSVFRGGKTKTEKFNLDFFYTFNPEGKSVIGFEKSSFNYEGSVWNINPDKLNTDKITFDLNKNEFNFSQFKLVSGEQEIAFTGSLKGKSEKILLADFTKVELESFLPTIDSLALKGTLSGNLDFVQKNNTYEPEATFSIKNFEVNSFKQGDLSLNIVGNNSYKKYNVNLSVENEKVKSFAATGSLDFSTERPLIDLEVFLEEFGLNAFSPLGKDVLSSLRGTASGDIFLKGFLGNPEMEGALTLKNAGLKFPYLNVDYNFGEEATVLLQQQSFILEDISLLDTKYKTNGILSGDITHLNFEKWFVNIDIDSNNLLVLDTENSEEALYYGTAFIDGTASITGLTEQLTIDVNAKTLLGTIFVVPLKDVETVSSYSLIHFKSKELEVKDRQKQVAREAIKGVSLNIDLEVTKEATAQVVIDEVYGSQLTGNGAGNLRIEINTRGKFNMYGDYSIEKGVYDFRYGGIINKPFVIQKGGVVSWNGNPYQANLDVTAVHKVKANPAVLLENFNSNRKIEVDLVTRITGGLFSSKQDLDIELNNVDPTIANELEFVLNDNNVNERTTQFISLLALGTFRDPNNSNFNANDAITGTASSAVAAAFSSLLSNPDSKFQLGVDYQQGTTDNDVERLNIDNQVDVSVSTQVSDRVIINGKVGVPVGAQTQSSVVGEVKVEVLLNDEGNFRTVIFNRQNEIQYSNQEEGYTQGVGLTYQVNFNTLSDLLRKIKSKKKKNISKQEKENQKKDSVNKNKDGLINFEGN